MFLRCETFKASLVNGYISKLCFEVEEITSDKPRVIRMFLESAEPDIANKSTREYLARRRLI